MEIFRKLLKDKSENVMQNIKNIKNPMEIMTYLSSEMKLSLEDKINYIMIYEDDMLVKYSEIQSIVDDFIRRFFPNYEFECIITKDKDMIIIQWLSEYGIPDTDAIKLYKILSY